MIVAVLIICLTAGILLTACKPKDPPGEDDSGDGGGGGDVMSTKDALENVIEFVYDNTYADVKFDGSVPIVIDVELDVVLGGETYTLVAKGNLDVRPEVTSKAEASAVQDNSELYIAIKKDAKTLIGIGYDVEGTGIDNLKPYLYLVSTDDNGANAVVKKVYGLSISKMMYDNANIEYVDDTFAADGAALASAEDGGIIGIIKGLPKLISSILFGSTCQVNSFGDGGIQYVFNFDLKNTITSLAGGGLLSILEVIGSAEIDKYIGRAETTSASRTCGAGHRHGYNRSPATACGLRQYARREQGEQRYRQVHLQFQQGQHLQQRVHCHRRFQVG